MNVTLKAFNAVTGMQWQKKEENIWSTTISLSSNISHASIVQFIKQVFHPSLHSKLTVTFAPSSPDNEHPSLHILINPHALTEELLIQQRFTYQSLGNTLNVMQDINWPLIAQGFVFSLHGAPNAETSKKLKEGPNKLPMTGVVSLTPPNSPVQDTPTSEAEKLKQDQQNIKKQISEKLTEINELFDDRITYLPFSPDIEEQKPYVVESGRTFSLATLKELQKTTNGEDTLSCPDTREGIVFSKKRLDLTLMGILKAFTENTENTAINGGRSFIAAIKPFLLTKDGAYIEEPVISSDGITYAVIKSEENYLLENSDGEQCPITFIEKGKYVINDSFFYTNYLLKNVITAVQELEQLYTEEDKVVKDLQILSTAAKQEAKQRAEEEIRRAEEEILTLKASFKDTQELLENFYLDEDSYIIKTDRMEDFCKIFATGKRLPEWATVEVKGRNILRIVYDNYDSFKNEAKFALYSELINNMKKSFSDDIFSLLYNSKTIIRGKSQSVCDKLEELEKNNDKTRMESQKKHRIFLNWWCNENKYTHLHKIFSTIASNLNPDIVSADTRNLYETAFELNDPKSNLNEERKNNLALKFDKLLNKIKGIDPSLLTVLIRFIELSKHHKETPIDEFNAKFLAFYASQKIFDTFELKDIKAAFLDTSFNYVGFLAYLVLDDNGMNEKGKSIQDSLLPLIDYLLTTLSIKIDPKLFKINDILAIKEEKLKFSQLNWIPYRSVSANEQNFDYLIKILLRHGDLTKNTKHPLIQELLQMKQDKQDELAKPNNGTTVINLFSPGFNNIFKKANNDEDEDSEAKFNRLIARIEGPLELACKQALQTKTIPFLLRDLAEALKQLREQKTLSTVKQVAFSIEAFLTQKDHPMAIMLLKQCEDIHPDVKTHSDLALKILDLFKTPNEEATEDKEKRELQFIRLTARIESQVECELPEAEEATKIIPLLESLTTAINNFKEDKSFYHVKQIASAIENFIIRKDDPMAISLLRLCRDIHPEINTHSELAEKITNLYKEMRGKTSPVNNMKH